MRRPSPNSGFKMAQTKACKAIHVVTCVKRRSQSSKKSAGRGQERPVPDKGWQIFSSFSPFLGHPHGDEHGQDENHTDGRTHTVVVICQEVLLNGRPQGDNAVPTNQTGQHEETQAWNKDRLNPTSHTVHR